VAEQPPIQIGALQLGGGHRCVGAARLVAVAVQEAQIGAGAALESMPGDRTAPDRRRRKRPAVQRESFSPGLQGPGFPSAVATQQSESGDLIG
jgi:cytochrome P450